MAKQVTVATKRLEGIDGLLDDLLTSAGVILWRADAQTFNTTFVSRAVEPLLGVPPERWVAEPGLWRSCLQQDDRERVIAMSSQTVQGPRAFLVRSERTAARGCCQGIL